MWIWFIKFISFQRNLPAGLSLPLQSSLQKSTVSQMLSTRTAQFFGWRLHFIWKLWNRPNIFLFTELVFANHSWRQLFPLCWDNRKNPAPPYRFHEASQSWEVEGFYFHATFQYLCVVLVGLGSLIKYRYRSSENWLGEQPHPASAGIKCSKFVFQQVLRAAPRRSDVRADK